jgi:hypothetical protein
MSTKRKRATEPPQTPDASDPPIELVVRRGALWRFNTLKKKTAELPVRVRWDRRQGDRRTATAEAPEDRRGTDRRQQPPFTWELADFVVVGQPAATDPTPARTRKKKKS